MSSDINTVTVLGAGNMGHGIAEVAALGGYDVNLRDISEELVQEGYEQIEWSVGKFAEKGQLSDDEAKATLDRIETYVDLESSVSDTDLVIEAVPEKMSIKKEVYEEVDASAPDHAILASNTSTLSITELASVTTRPERVCGMHFFNPPVRMPLVEVVAGEQTDDEVLSTAESLAEEMDKTPVLVRKDVPGFIVNRILVPLLNEAAWLVEEGKTTVSEVDSTTKFGLGLPMGTFELADQVGIDIVVDVLNYMHTELGEAYRPAPLLVDKVENEQLGQKTGEGFYTYEEDGVEIPSDQQSESIKHKLVAVAANELAKLVEADVASTSEIDQALMLGAAFPQGPSQIAEDVGYDTLFEVLQESATDTNRPQHQPSPLLKQWGANNQDQSSTTEDSTYDTLEITYPADGVAQLTLDRPHQLNVINMQVLDDLDTAIEELEDDSDTRTVVLASNGDRAFCAGADIKDLMGDPDPFDASELSEYGQQVFGKLRSASMPVIAAVDGACFGGGMELVICADLCVAEDAAKFGQPEHDLGILPAWGGTQRLRQIVGDRRAREIIFTTNQYDPETMVEYGFVNEVVDNSLEAAVDLAEEMAAGPPLAQAATKRVMNIGFKDYEAGLNAEADAFGLLWTTDDAQEGVTAFLNDRDPDFDGS